jgi:CheY-like chemotaxis protein
MAHTRTILVVDDDDMARDVITRLLKRAVPQMQVVGARDGETGWSSFTELRPAMLVTDMKMGGMTGAELIAKVREVDREVPIIVITGAPEALPIPGATAVILKVNFDLLMRRVKELLGIEAAT